MMVMMLFMFSHSYLIVYIGRAIKICGTMSYGARLFFVEYESKSCNGIFDNFHIGALKKSRINRRSLELALNKNP